jgi:hypothetical protein
MLFMPDDQAPIAPGTAPETPPDQAPPAASDPPPASENEAAPALESLKREWGAQYDANIGFAKRLVAEVASPELIEAIGRSGLGDDPSMVRAVAEIARRLYAAANPTDKNGVRARLDELHALQFDDDPRRRGEYRSPKIQAELAKLYRALHGSGAIVGRDARVV